MSTIKDARKLVVPSALQQRSIKKIAESAFKLVEEQTGKYSQVLDVEFGGSYAKGTWLAECADIDVFIRFKKNTVNSKFVEISQKIGFDAMNGYNPSVRYSDHPYVEAEIRKTRINIVPCYDVKPGRWKSAADRSPYHTRYMQKALTSRMRNEVRLLKAFLSSAGIYGAEIAKQGLSGYVSEVLIREFGSFNKVVKAIAATHEGLIIGNTNKKFETPVTIVDPIDDKRNLAAAISGENLGTLVLCCRAFQKNPSLQFFKTAVPRESLIHPKNVLIVRFGFSPRSPEIIWGQIKRATASLATQLNVAGFNVLRSRAYTDERKDAGLLFLLESVKISEIRANVGPAVHMENYANKFIEKNLPGSKLMWVDEKQRIVSLEERRFNDARLFLNDLLTNSRQTGLPKGLRDDFDAGFKISTNTRELSKSIKEAVRALVSTDEEFFYFN